MPTTKPPTVFVVSDGRGETCNQLVRAALVQFEGQRFRVVRVREVRTPEAVRKVVERAAAGPSIIFYTLVSEDTRAAVQAAAEELLVPTVDLLGPTFSALRDLFQVAPVSTPGLLYASDREYFNRLEAIDYTLKHDDGQRPHELDGADVVLAGVSRASKSSTCFFLAYEGIRAANVPLIRGMKPLPQLTNLDPECVIGLRINVMRLLTVREARAFAARMDPTDPYIDKREVAREVREANAIMDRHGWRTIDVSYRAVEEIAREIRHLRGL